jgi:hypothetical protein
MSHTTFTKALFVAALAALAAGCAAEPQKKGLEDMRLTPELVEKVRKDGKVELSGDDQVICRQEMPTGSHRAIWRCDTYAAYDERARKNQREIQKAQFAPKAKVGF